MIEHKDQRGVTAADGTTKARIERAAVNLFAARGIDAVTTREIAAASGISEGAIYRHYPSKSALAETIFLFAHHYLADEIREASAGAGSIDDKVKAVVRAYCQLADNDWDLFSYHLLTTHYFLPASQRSGTREQKNPVVAVEAIIADAMARKEIPAGDPALKCAMALGVVFQSAYHKLYGRIAGDLSDHSSQMTRAVIAVLNTQ